MPAVPDKDISATTKAHVRWQMMETVLDKSTAVLQGVVMAHAGPHGTVHGAEEAGALVCILQESVQLPTGVVHQSVTAVHALKLRLAIGWVPRTHVCLLVGGHSLVLVKRRGKPSGNASRDK